MIDCDASKYGIGAVLLQQKDETKPTEWANVGYFSKTLSKEQRDYSPTERECYAVVRAILTLRKTSRVRILSCGPTTMRCDG